MLDDAAGPDEATAWWAWAAALILTPTVAEPVAPAAAAAVAVAAVPVRPGRLLVAAVPCGWDNGMRTRAVAAGSPDPTDGDAAPAVWVWVEE